MTETTEPTTPTPARRRTAALWIGAACVAAMGYIAGRTVWWLLLGLLSRQGVSVAWNIAIMSVGWLPGVLVAWWAVAKWSGAVGLCPSFSAWRRRWTALGVVVGVMAAMWLLDMVIQTFSVKQTHAYDFTCDLPEPLCLDPETGEPLAVHTVNVRAGFDLPSGDAELARTAWRMAGDDGAEPPEPPHGAPEEE